jgi:hypothetical protein
MVFTINQDILTKLTIVAVIGIVVVGALIVLQVAGVFGDGDTPLEPGETPPVPTPPFETPPSQAEDEKTLMLNWTYRDRPFSYTTVITNATYDAFRLRDPGVTPDMTTGDAVARYVTTDGDAGTIGGIADYILEQSVQNGWGDYDTIRNTAAFVQRYGSGGFTENISDGRYRYPVETLWEETGGREDVTILAASLLKDMGYPVALLVFPEQYDRGYLIPEYTAIGIRCKDVVEGRTYTESNAEEIGTVICYPQNRTFDTPDSPSFEANFGYFTGNATVDYADGRTVAAGEAAWDIPSGVLTYREDFRPPRGTPVSIAMENASYVTEESFVYVDVLNATYLPGEVPGALAKAEPEIVTTLIDAENDITVHRDDLIDSSLTPLLRTPSPLKTEKSPGLKVDESIKERLGLPASTGSIFSEVDTVNRVKEDDYWQDVWYDTRTDFHDEVWYLEVLNYEVPGSRPLYTRANEMYISPTSPWRIKYQAVPLNVPDRDLEGLSPFSEMRFVVYKVDEGNSTVKFVGEFAHGHTSGQETVNYHAFYETGNFYIVTFVRNCEAEVAIQMHGRGPLP